MATDSPADERPNFLAVAMLIDELQKDDVQVRINAVLRVDFVAQTLGPTRTREELVPYLAELVDDEDEVILALAEAFGKLREFIGGLEHCHVLLPALEKLAGVEETPVRLAAIKSLRAIASEAPAAVVQDHMIDLLKRLATNPWFSCRMSASGIYAAAYPRVNSRSRADIVRMFLALCEDQTPMVRRAACKDTGSLAAVVELDVLQTHVLGKFRSLIRDDQDSVRLLAVESIVAIGQRLLTEGSAAHAATAGVVPTPDEAAVASDELLLPLILALGEDTSWRVRYAVAESVLDMFAICSPTAGRTKLLPMFCTLLGDNEPEVRAVASPRISGVSRLVGEALAVERLLAPVRNLVTDASKFARAALAGDIMSFAGTLQSATVTEHLLPLFLGLLQDEASKVRLNLIASLDSAGKQVLSSESLADDLLPAITQLAQDPKWRVRQEIIKHTAVLARQLGEKLFETRLLERLYTWLEDDVHAIRQEAGNTLATLCTVFGEPWARSHLIPLLARLAGHRNYLMRSTAVHAVIQLGQALSAASLVDDLLPILLDLARDQVANIRFVVAKSIPSLKACLQAAQASGGVQTALRGLLEDADDDVRFFAQETLDALAQEAHVPPETVPITPADTAAAGAGAAAAAPGQGGA